MPKALYSTIMLIDDDAEDHEIFADAMRHVAPGTSCLCLESGEAALDQLSSNQIKKPDLIFLDLNMPKQNGKQVLLELKQVLPDVPVIMFSTFFGERDITDLRATGAAHYIIKHTNFADLCEALGNVLSKKW